MKFSSKEDIEAPIEHVFGAVSEFEAFERMAIRRGAEVQRIIDIPGPKAGITWQADFRMRGKDRAAKVELVSYDSPNEMAFEFVSGGLLGYLDVDLVALSPRRTRMSVGFELKPQTLPARLLVQSLKLAKSNLTKKFQLRVADYAKTMEERYTRMA